MAGRADGTVCTVVGWVRGAGEAVALRCEGCTRGGTQGGLGGLNEGV